LYKKNAERLLTEGNTVAVIKVDLGGRIVHLSENASGKLGIHFNAENEYFIVSFFPSESNENIVNRVMQHLRGDKILPKEYVLKKENGSAFKAKVFTLPEYNDRGNITHLNYVIYDIDASSLTVKNESESNMNLLSLIESIDTLIWCVNVKDFGLTAFNKSYKQKVFEDYGKIISLGDKPDDILPYHIAEKWKGWYWRALNEGKFKDFYKTKNPERIYSISFNRIIVNSAVEGISVYAKEITEYIKIKTELHKEVYLNRTLLKSIPVFCVIISEDKKTKLMNNLLLRTLGCEEEDVLEKDYFKLFVPKVEAPYLEHEIERIKICGTEIHVENHLIKKDGSTILTEWNVSPYYDENGKHIYLIAIGSDITSRREKEIELLNSKMSLEELVRDRNSELEQANELLKKEIAKQKEMKSRVKKALMKEKELNELKSHFMSMASHEFKSPLTTIYSSAELLERYGAKLEPEMYAQQTDRIKKQILHLNELIDDVLMLGKTDIENHAFNPSKINLKRLCDVVIDDMKIMLQPGHELKLNVELKEEMFSLDEMYVKCFIINLLSNSIKYSPEGGRIEFSVRQEGNSVIFIFTDEGIGIALEDQKKLYSPFHRGNNVGEIRGTGLGLSIAKKAIDLHKGKIECKSVLKKGTTFIVSIPQSGSAVERKQTADKKRKAFGGKEAVKELKKFGRDKTSPEVKKILLIEDEKDIRENIKYLLEEENYKVTAVTSGEEGLERYHQMHPDIILCDIMLPGIDGYEVLKTINSLEKHLPVPFIFVSAKTGYRNLRQGMELGADDYIFKPFNAQELVKSVKRCLKKYESLKLPGESDLIIKNDNKENIFVRYRGRMIPLPIMKIIYISIQGQYSKIFMEGKKQYTLKRALKKWESLLPSNLFIRIHRSTLVNISQINKIEKISNNSYKVFLRSSESTLELSRRYFKNIKKHSIAN